MPRTTTRREAPPSMPAIATPTTNDRRIAASSRPRQPGQERGVHRAIAPLERVRAEPPSSDASSSPRDRQAWWLASLAQGMTARTGEAAGGPGCGGGVSAGRDPRRRDCRAYAIGADPQTVFQAASIVTGVTVRAGPPSNAAKARQENVVQTARDNNMTLRQIARHTAAGTSHRSDRRHGRIHGRRDGEMAQGRGGRRLQRRMQPLSQAVRGLRARRSCRAAAARHLPDRVRRRHVAART